MSIDSFGDETISVGSWRAIPKEAALEVYVERSLHQRQPDEGARAWEAFCCYRDMGPKRSITRVAQKLGKSGSMISRWSGRHRWQERVSSWQTEQDACAAEDRRELIRCANRRHLAVAKSMFKAIHKSIAAASQAPELSPRDVAAWARVAVQIERDALGLTRATPSTVEQDKAPAVTFTRDPTGCLPDHVIQHAQDSLTHDEALAAAHAILRKRRERALPELQADEADK